MSIVKKSARIIMQFAGKLKQFSLRIVTYGPEFESDFRLMRTTYWTSLLALDARSFVCCILMFAAKLEFSFLFRRKL